MLTRSLCVVAALCALAHTVSAESVIEVRTDRPQKPIPSFGLNMVYAKGGRGIVDEHGRFTKAAVDSLDEIKPQWLRFPGGTISNTYRWQRAIGPVARRTKNVHGWNRYHTPISNAYGPDEAARYMKRVDGSLVICVSMSSETPQSAADWVEYMNCKVGENPNGGVDWAAVRARNGQHKPYGIKQWELGNESGGRTLKTWNAWPFEGDDNLNGGVKQGSQQCRRWWIHGGSKRFKHQKAVRVDSWANSAIRTRGEANETYYLKFPPCAEVQLRLGQNAKDAEPWARVETFKDSRPDSKHFVVEKASGKIRFGDGHRGATPPARQFVFADYVSGPHGGSNDFYRAMKKVDPEITITASYWGVLPEYAKNPGKVLFDGHQFHFGHYFKNFDGPLDDDGFTEAVARGYFATKHHFDGVKKLLNKHRIPESTRITVSETNLQYELVDSKGVDHRKTISGALMFALAMERASRFKQIEVLGFSYLDSVRKFHTNRRDYYVTPQGLAIKMFTDHFGRLAVETNAKVPTRSARWRAPKQNDTPSVRVGEIPNVVTLASHDLDKKRLYIMGINTTKSDSVDSSIQILGSFELGDSPEVSVTTLSADAISSMNTMDNPRKIRISQADPSRIRVSDRRFRFRFPAASITVICLEQRI